MVAIVSAETLLLVLLIVLVAGLLRSNAEILRRLGPPGEVESELGSDLRSEGVGEIAAAPTTSRPRDALAPALAGATPDGDAIRLAFDGGTAAPTLLAFLTTGCATCAGFWESLGERRLPPEVQIVIVTHGADRERPARLRSLAPPRIPLVMSSEAWQDYEVPGSPYFVLVDRVVRGEGVATTWPVLASLVSDAIEDQREAGVGRAGTQRARRVEATLAANGIGSDHPSLYPGGQPAVQEPVKGSGPA